MRIADPKNVYSKEDFVDYVQWLKEDLKTNSEEWENDRLDRFLDAMGRWTETIERYYNNTNQSLPENINWKVFADILAAAKIYE